MLLPNRKCFLIVDDNFVLCIEVTAFFTVSEAKLV